jgi:hypothetical protein
MKVGRRTILTKGLAARLCKIISEPCSIRSACESVGVSQSAFFSWIRRGEKGQGKLYVQFVQRLMRAKGRGKVKVQRNIWDCDDPRVKLELLSRLYPDEFGRVAERELPAEQAARRIDIAFVLPSGQQISEAKARALAALPPANEQATAQTEPEREWPTEPEPEPELTAGELFDGNISKLGRFVGDVPLS